MAQLFILVMGHNGSGKTHVSKKLAERFQLNRVNGDDFRIFVYEHIKYFQEVNNSYPGPKNNQLQHLVNDYRIGLTNILLDAGESVIFDGSGSTKQVRTKYLSQLKAKYPNLKSVIVWTDITEPELLERLQERDKDSNARWTDMYHNIKKELFEPPTEDEADVLLRYDQANYDDIERQIGTLLS